MPAIAVGNMLDKTGALDFIDRIIGKLTPWELKEVLNVIDTLCLNDINTLKAFGHTITAG
jgi:hypothetical protein